MSILTVIDLPMPPSVNRIWRASKTGKRMVSRSPLYRKWISDADKLTIAMGTMKGRQMIKGRFTAEITLPLDNWDKDPPFDVDNRHKGVLDWAQSRGLVFTDRRCMSITVRWGSRWEAPTGCRLRLQEWKAPNDVGTDGQSG